MVRLLFSVLVILFSSSGCSHLQPIPQPHTGTILTKSTRLDITESTDDRSAEFMVDGDTSKRSIADAAFAGVFVPVYFTGCFIEWVTHGCPDP